MEEKVITEHEIADSEPVEETAELAAEETDEEDYTADVDDTDYEDAEDEDVELEYDEDGNIVIPDDEAEEEGDTTPNEEEPTAPPSTPPATTDAEELHRTKQELEALRAQTQRTLKSMGYEDGDVLEGLERLEAESLGQTPEEHREAKKEEALKKEGLLALYEQKKAEDLAAVVTACPEAAKYKLVTDFPNFKRFSELRDLGLSAPEAFRATHPADLAASAAASAKQTARNDSKDHLQSNIPRRVKDTSVKIPRAELDAFRELFPKASDKELVALYKRASK